MEGGGGVGGWGVHGGVVCMERGALLFLFLFIFILYTHAYSSPYLSFLNSLPFINLVHRHGSSGGESSGATPVPCLASRQKIIFPTTAMRHDVLPFTLRHIFAPLLYIGSKH